MKACSLEVSKGRAKEKGKRRKESQRKGVALQNSPFSSNFGCVECMVAKEWDHKSSGDPLNCHPPLICSWI